MWYTTRIGEVFDIHKVDHEMDIYWVRTRDEWNSLNFVKVQDCDLVF